jgi:hypothetical protein
MSYISSRNKTFIPVSEIKIGDKVCYKNANDNWYEGVVESEEGEHQCLLAPRKKRGVMVDYGDISLIQEIKELFTYESKKNKNINMYTGINFKLKGKPKSFYLEHNLDKFGLSIDAAFVNWSARTKDFSEKSFCDYVVSKDPHNLICKVADLKTKTQNEKL